MTSYALNWLKNRLRGTETNDVDYGSSLGRGGGSFDTAKYGMGGDNDAVAMDPSQLLGRMGGAMKDRAGRAVKEASDFLNKPVVTAPGVSPWEQNLHNAIFGKSNSAPSRPGQLSQGEVEWQNYAHSKDRTPYNRGGSGMYELDEYNRRKRGY